MFDILLSLFAPVFQGLASLYDADTRPDARRITIGCAVVVFGIIILVCICFGF